MIISRRLGDRLRIDVPADEVNNTPPLIHYLLESDLDLACTRIFGAGSYSFQQIAATEWSISSGGSLMGKASIVGPAKPRPRPCSSCSEARKRAQAASAGCPGSKDGKC